MKTAVCCIAKYENRYIREFVEYYLRLGFDNILIYDNNDIDGEKFEDVISDYIESGVVIMHNVRGISNKNFYDLQKTVYNNSYWRYFEEYDWIMYVDVDEFLFIDNNLGIKEYLSQDKFNNFQFIYVGVIIYDDNDLVRDDGRPCTERFTHWVDPFDKDNVHAKMYVKMIIRGHLENVILDVHNLFFRNIYMGCDSTGQTLEHQEYFYMNNIPIKDAHIRHYKYKTAEEYCKYRMPKGSLNIYYSHQTREISEFFKYNKYTPEKYYVLVSNGDFETSHCIQVDKLDNFLKFYDTPESYNMLGVTLFRLAIGLIYSRDHHMQYDFLDVYRQLKKYYYYFRFRGVTCHYDDQYADFKGCMFYGNHVHITEEQFKSYGYVEPEFKLANTLIIGDFLDYRFFWNKKPLINVFFEPYNTTIDFGNTVSIDIRSEDIDTMVIYSVMMIYGDQYKYILTGEISQKIREELNSELFHVEQNDSIFKDLYIMSNCSVNIILGDNLIAWWGAFLNTRNSKVYAQDILLEKYPLLVLEDWVYMN